jgi:hypothetical protein
MLIVPGTRSLKLKRDELFSRFAFKVSINLMIAPAWDQELEIET